MSIGLDGCPTGWFGVHRDGSELGFGVFRTLTAVLATYSGQTVAIDVPIGLPNAGSRQVDQAARRQLGCRRSSVFPAPIRPVLIAPDRATASAIGERTDGRRLTAQTWAIVPKIIEADNAVRTDRELLNRIHECHPEVCWTAMNGGGPMQNRKKTAAGRAERLALVDRQFGVSGRAVYDAARERYLRHEVALDDILDAFACLWTAERIDAGQALHILNRPEIDPLGIPMQMAC